MRHYYSPFKPQAMAELILRQGSPPNKGLPWTIGGSLFFCPQGWTSVQTLVEISLSVSMQIPFFSGANFDLDFFEWSGGNSVWAEAKQRH